MPPGGGSATVTVTVSLLLNSASETVSRNVRVDPAAGAVKVGLTPEAPERDTVGPPVWVHW